MQCSIVFISGSLSRWVRNRLEMADAWFRASELDGSSIVVRSRCVLAVFEDESSSWVEDMIW